MLDSELVDRVWDQLLASDEVQKLVERIAEAPEVRAAIASQGVGLIGDIGREIREIADRLDDAIERVVRRLLGKPQRPPSPRSESAWSPAALAFLLDGVILNGTFLLIALAVVSGAVRRQRRLRHAGWAVGALAWVLGGSAYLLTFWSLAGQTPGMRFLSIRIEAGGSPRIGLARALAAGSAARFSP